MQSTRQDLGLCVTIPRLMYNASVLLQFTHPANRSSNCGLLVILRALAHRLEAGMPPAASIASVRAKTERHDWAARGVCAGIAGGTAEAKRDESGAKCSFSVLTDKTHLARCLSSKPS